MIGRHRGIVTPLITPVTEDEAPDLPSLRRLAEFQISAGVSGLWAMGTTSEFASFDESERAAVIGATRLSQCLAASRGFIRFTPRTVHDC